MAFGIIKADTLTHSTAGSVDTNFVVEGSSKAWVYLNGTGTIAINDSFNVSTATDEGTAEYGFNFTSSMNNINYCWTGISGAQSGANANMVVPHDPNTTSKVTMETWVYNASKADRDTNNVAVMGDLA